MSLPLISKLYKGLIKLDSQDKLLRTFNKKDILEVRKCNLYYQWERQSKPSSNVQKA